MNNFGSSRLRICWAGFYIFLTGMVFACVRDFETTGGRFIIFGIESPLGFDNPKPYVVESLGRAIYTVVPAIILLGGFVQLGDWITTGGRVGRYRWLAVGSIFAFLHGVLLSQLAILPILAAGYRLLGNPFVSSVVVADINALILGLQLLLWAAALSLILKSNRGLTVFCVYVLGEIGRVMTWGGEFLGYLEVNKFITSIMTFFGQALPSNQLPSDPIAWTTLYVSLGAPLLFAALLILLPGKLSKRTRS